jgi:glycosyltransferase involved in cell wall biosynthesis
LKKIVNIIPAISHEASGPSYSVVRLTQALLNFRFNILILTLNWFGNEKKKDFVIYFPISFPPKKLGVSLQLKLWLENELSTNQVTLIHNHGMWQMNSIYPGKLASKFNIPYVVSPRGSFSLWALNSGSIFKYLFWTFLQKPSFKGVTCFHATALSEYNDIRRMGFKQPVAVIPNGIDIPLYNKQINSNDYRTVLFLGRIHSVKGVDILLKAWNKVYDLFPNWKLSIVGDDSGFHKPSGYLKEIKNLSIELQLKNIEFLGPKFGNDKWKAYAEADLFVLPSYSENFGITVAEALASGTPCIVSKGAPWSGLEKVNAGKWIDIGVEPLVKSLISLMSKDVLELRDMGLRGREWMEIDFSWDNVSKQMNTLYEWVASKKNDCPSFLKLD